MGAAHRRDPPALRRGFARGAGTATVLAHDGKNPHGSRASSAPLRPSLSQTPFLVRWRRAPGVSRARGRDRRTRSRREQLSGRRGSKRRCHGHGGAQELPEASPGGAAVGHRQIQALSRCERAVRDRASQAAAGRPPRNRRPANRATNGAAADRLRAMPLIRRRGAHAAIAAVAQETRGDELRRRLPQGAVPLGALDAVEAGETARAPSAHRATKTAADLRRLMRDSIFGRGPHTTGAAPRTSGR